MKIKLHVSLLFVLLFGLFAASCKKEDSIDVAPQQEQVATENSNPSSESNSNGNPSAEVTPISYGTPPSGNGVYFSGINWNVRTNNMAQGPGPNYFSNSSNNVWVDAQVICI
jgi:hypothetical protein